MKQTAVEWIEEKLKENLKHIVINNDYVLMESIFLQAKQMEKEQIVDAFGVGCQVESTRLIGYQDMAEQYYNETYKSQNNE